MPAEDKDQLPTEEDFKQTFTLKEGDQAWVEDEKECYTKVTVKSVANEDENTQVFTVFNADYKTTTVKSGHIFPVNPSSMNGVEDNTQLMWLHDPNLLANLIYRYEADNIYTYTAHILIAMNPYKKLTIYSDDKIKEYNDKSLGALPPHVFAMADRSYRILKASKRNQSIVVSGESGAGKTETCKFIMRFFAMVTGATEGSIGSMEKKILDANPLMEAFGNAKTLRNNNSSRFGKYTTLHFDGGSKLVGASIVTYLLEKSRLVFQSKGERNFHIFYQLVKGSSADEKAKYHLKSSPEDYFYLSQSGCTTSEDADDVEDFKNLKLFFTEIGVNETEQSALFQTLSGLLLLGNTKFAAKTRDGAEKKETDDDEEKNADDKVTVAASAIPMVESAAEMLGFDKQLLLDRLVNRTITVGRSKRSTTYTIPLNEQEATYARDALAKHIYGLVFDWLVNAINKNIPQGDTSNIIGILDISGFEIFENNTFEQLCINFANEKIQEYFNRNIIAQEQEIYLLEGLRFRQVEYEDNHDVIELVEAKKVGMFAILDEQCIMPKATDQTFCTKIHTQHAGNERLSVPKYSKKMKGRRLNKDEGFVVSHFAGQVTYQVKAFLDKNNDTLHYDLENLLEVTKSDWIKKLTPKPEDDEEVDAGATKKRFKSVSAKFQTQLTKLMEDLEATQSHFIRCIKPNELKKPGVVNKVNVMQQLRYNGMCTALELMQYGFPTRIGFDELYRRYAPLMPAVIANLKPIMFCEAVLVALDLHGGKDFQMGLTKVFFRAGKLKFLDDLTSTSADTMRGIAGKVRQWLARKRWRMAGYAVVALNRCQRIIRLIRGAHRFRRAGRFMLKMVRVWLPLARNARVLLEQSEAYKKKKEEEARRREEERLAEIARKEAEEKARLERKEARRRAREEEKEMLRQQTTLEAEKRQEVQAQLEQANKIGELQKSRIKNMEDQIEELNGVQEQLEATKASLETDKEKLKEDLVAEKDDKEKQAFEAQQLLHRTEQKLNMEISTRDVKINELKQEIADLNAQHAKEKQKLNDKIAALEADLAKEKQEHSDLQAAHTKLKKQHTEANFKIDKYEKERQSLIDTALKAQEDQRKLKIVIDKFAKKQEAYLKMLHGNLSFQNIAKNATLYSELKKQGGSSEKKWQTRHVVLNENYLYYFDNVKSKEPKGLVRADQCTTSRYDLAKLNMANGFTVVNTLTGRQYFFCANSDDEVVQWISALLRVQGWSETEIKQYHEVNKDARSRAGSVNPPKK